MEYFIVVLVVLILAAKLSQMKTPPKEQHLVAMRRHAGALGLRVELVPDVLAHQIASAVPVVRYLLPWSLQFDTGRAGFCVWTLVRGSSRGQVSEWNGWRWRASAAPASVCARLAATIAALPSDAVAVQCDRGGLSVYWGERGSTESIDRLYAELFALNKIYINQ